MKRLMVGLLAISLFGQVPKGGGGGGGGGSSSGGSGVSYCAPASASGTAYTCTPSPAVTLSAGSTLGFVPDVVGVGGATTVTVNGVTKSIKRADGSTDPLAYDLVALRSINLLYDGSVFRIIGTGTGVFTCSIATTIAPFQQTCTHNLGTFAIAYSAQDSSHNGLGGSGSFATTTQVNGYQCATINACTFEFSGSTTTPNFYIWGPAQGPPGNAGTIAVGTVTSVPVGSSPTVVNVGTANAAILNFGLPSGSTTRSLTYVFSGTDVSAGTIGAGITMPSTCTLAAWDIDTKANDTATIKVLKIATGTTSPTIGNSISTSGVAISTGGHVHSTTLSDFTTTTFTQYDVVAFDLLATGGIASKVAVTLSFTGCQ